MTAIAKPFKRKQMFYGGMFLLGIIVTLMFSVRLVQTIDTKHVFRILLEILVLLYFVVKTVDYYKGYRKYAGTGPQNQ